MQLLSLPAGHQPCISRQQPAGSLFALRHTARDVFVDAASCAPTLPRCQQTCWAGALSCGPPTSTALTALGQMTPRLLSHPRRTRSYTSGACGSAPPASINHAAICIKRRVKLKLARCIFSQHRPHQTTCVLAPCGCITPFLCRPAHQTYCPPLPPCLAQGRRAAPRPEALQCHWRG
jgi:hypothetical protein